MIPLLATVKYKGRWSFRFWIPLFLVWILLLPIFLILLPFFCIGCFIVGMNPFRVLGVFADVLSAVKGTEIEVAQFPHSFLIQIR